jgi:hypothetical protein
MQKSVWVSLVIIAVLLVSCGPATQPVTSPETESGDIFMLALPRIVIDVDSAGIPSLLGVKPTDIGLGPIGLDKALVDLMTAANVQHIELRMVGNGILLFVNGKPLPHIGWSDESLLQASDLAALANVQDAQIELIKKFVPVVRRLGLDLALRFPRQAGVAEIPLIDPEEAIKLAAAPSDEPAMAVVKFEIRYDASGVPGILGITASDLTAMGISLPVAVTPETIQVLQARNIQYLELRGQSNGVFLYVNGNPLPNIVWDESFLTNAADLYLQMSPAGPFDEVIRTVVPALHRADLTIVVHFPLASGAQPIPVKLH